MSGTLYLIATPIGHLGDITQRALETLRAVDLIACEDTRRTGTLLQHAGIRTPTLSLHDHNERSRTPHLLARLEAGESIALVSDGGTPLVCDPGWWLVQQAIARKIPVSWIPGPTALIGALVLSGLPMDRFVFEGFLPVKTSARHTRMAALKEERRTVVLYEGPHRLLTTLRELQHELGDVPAVCARELTKRFEEVCRGTLSTLVTHFEQHPPRGEVTLVLRPVQESTPRSHALRLGSRAAQIAKRYGSAEPTQPQSVG